MSAEEDDASTQQLDIPVQPPESAQSLPLQLTPIIRMSPLVLAFATYAPGVVCPVITTSATVTLPFRAYRMLLFDWLPTIVPSTTVKVLRALDEVHEAVAQVPAEPPPRVTSSARTFHPQPRTEIPSAVKVATLTMSLDAAVPESCRYPSALRLSMVDGLDRIRMTFPEVVTSVNAQSVAPRTLAEAPPGAICMPPPVKVSIEISSVAWLSIPVA